MIAPGEIVRAAVLLLFVLVATACGASGEAERDVRPSGASAEHPSPGSSATGADVIELPAPRRAGDLTLEEALAARRSVRDFTDESLSLEEVSQLLWAAQGITAGWGGRTAPSAGALYPLSVHAVTRERILLYVPDGHRARVVGTGDLRPALAEAAGGQGAITDAPLVLVLSGNEGRSAAKYGARAERYVHLEAGHAAQNVLLQAVALGLGAVPIGAFDDDRVRDLLGLPAGLTPLYLIPIGHAAET